MGFFDALGGIANGIIGGIITSNENRKQYNRQKSLLQMQQDYNTTMWNANNEYNTPQAQYQRLLDAGVNPAAAVNSLTGGQSTQVATPTAPTPAYVGNPGDSAMQGLSVFSQFLQAMANVNKTKADTKLAEAQTALAEKDANVRDAYNNLTVEKLQVEINNVLANTGLTYSQKSELDYQVSEMLPVLKQKTEQERQNLAQDYINKIQDLANLIKQGNFLDEQSRTQRAQQVLLGEQANTQREQQQLIREQTRSTGFQADVQSVHSTLASSYGVDISQDLTHVLVELSLAGHADLVPEVVRIMTGTTVDTGAAIVDQLGSQVLDAAGSVVNGVIDHGRKHGLLKYWPGLKSTLSPGGSSFQSISNPLPRLR